MLNLNQKGNPRMSVLKRSIFIIVGFFSLFFSLNAQAFSFSDFLHIFSPSHTNSQENIKNTILARTEGLSPHVLSLALRAYGKLRQAGYDGREMLTIVDYSKPSVEPRLWVINLKDLQVPVRALVANGKNNGDNTFSDRPSSHDSSIGVYLTSNTYFGKHGYSLRINGLEKGFNDKARARDIVMHSAFYVSEAFAHIHGRLGRSWGCFALSPAVAPEIINKIKDGTVLFAYYPDPRWLNHSTYLT
jgi:hypothetical protein